MIHDGRQPLGYFSDLLLETLGFTREQLALANAVWELPVWKKKTFNTDAGTDITATTTLESIPTHVGPETPFYLPISMTVTPRKDAYERWNRRALRDVLDGLGWVPDIRQDQRQMRARFRFPQYESHERIIVPTIEVYTTADKPGNVVSGF